MCFCYRGSVYPITKNQRLKEKNIKHKCENLPNVIFPLIISGGFLVSAMAAIGIPQLATGPQKCVLQKRKKKYY